jgi:hypothetical protein
MRRAAMIGDRVASNLDAYLKLIRLAIRGSGKLWYGDLSKTMMPNVADFRMGAAL